jgi:hypothetical protein
VEVPLDFLGAGEYEATVYTDAPGGDPKKTAIGKRRVARGEKLVWKLSPAGGAAARVRPAAGR